MYFFYYDSIQVIHQGIFTVGTDKYLSQFGDEETGAIGVVYHYNRLVSKYFSLSDNYSDFDKNM